MLLGLEPPKPDESLPQLEPDRIKVVVNNRLAAEHSKKITKASFDERDEYWKTRTDVGEADRMKVWEKSMDAFLDAIKTADTKKEQHEFLKRILRQNDQQDLEKVEVSARIIYSTFMQEGGGDVEFFTRRIVKNNSIQEIGQNQELIKKLGNIYGKNSSKIAELLTYGIANANNNLDRFISSAQENLNNGNYGEDVWTPLEKNNAQWEEKQKEKKKQGTGYTSHALNEKPQPTQPPQPEQSVSHKESHPLAADTGATSKKDLWKGVPNQDAYFADHKHGAFGVFDGVGGSIQGEVASSIASKHIEEILAEMSADLPLDKAEEAVGKALIEANQKIWEINEPRYIQKKAEYEKKRAPNPLTKQDLAEIDSESCMSTTAVVVKLWHKTDPTTSKPKTNGEKKAIVAWAGDSRVYLLRQGKLERITIDDTPLRDLMSHDLAKKIHNKKDNDKYNRKEMEKIAVVLKSSDLAAQPLLEQIKRDPKGITMPAYPFPPGVEIAVPYSYFDFPGITKTLSRGDLEPNVQSIDIEPGDRIIITSDGIHDYSLTSEMEKILNDPTNQEAEKAAQALVKLAKKEEEHAPRDDATAVVINIR